MSNPSEPSKSAYPTAIITTTFGDITIELWDDIAPKHAANFLRLARNGFYDGLGFHRILRDFVVQGGCPNGTGTGGPGWTVDSEFNDCQHEAGTLSMARSAHPNSAGSQFFICLGREHCRHLDGNYTAFGRVTEGMDVVRKIEQVPVNAEGRPSDMPRMTTVRVVGG